MSLFKIILVIFLIYFIRRFLQMYRALRAIQLEREIKEREEFRAQEVKRDKAVDAEYKVID